MTVSAPPRLLVRFFVPGRPANLGNGRMHWGEKARVVASERAATRVIGGAAMGHAKVGKATGKRKLVLTLMLAGQILDRDNAYSAGKPYCDGVQDCGLILDDSPEWCDLEVRQKKVRFRDTQGVMVEVWE